MMKYQEPKDITGTPCGKSLNPALEDYCSDVSNQKENDPSEDGSQRNPDPEPMFDKKIKGKVWDSILDKLKEEGYITDERDLSGPGFDSCGLLQRDVMKERMERLARERKKRHPASDMNTYPGKAE